ncbi:hypothetical protein BOTNAR_1941g00010 [Botryotinia narcissicola]|uniref:Uncharacterized protein n=1 Tax=Botryotinia narcissicola TaxID=278944 RepID=A0A4Z1H515_9HELO|nr:hypothetical protein BOTNAR_1941g00010 [Botryotinia narcissicola]
MSKPAADIKVTPDLLAFQYVVESRAIIEKVQSECFESRAAWKGARYTKRVNKRAPVIERKFESGVSERFCPEAIPRSFKNTEKDKSPAPKHTLLAPIKCAKDDITCVIQDVVAESNMIAATNRGKAGNEAKRDQRPRSNLAHGERYNSRKMSRIIPDNLPDNANSGAENNNYQGRKLSENDKYDRSRKS